MTKNEDDLQGRGESRTEETLEVREPETALKALEEEKEKADRYLTNWQRAEADLMNLKRRSEVERNETTMFANSGLVLDLLPVLDDLERALENAGEDIRGNPWVDGVALIYRKLKTVLENRGLAEIEAEGEEFDPAVHEAVMCVEGEDGKVMGVIRKGYKFRDRVLRPAMVYVGQEKSAEPS
ncbi:MAG: nucleotide exchange factor GrpE [Dehalococcoidia bacterium]|nr:nucleotide exchange factor GrpE [Dehalococcoidia bacterium]